MNKDIKAGEDIRDKVFGGNPYAQLSLIRKSIWALAVLNGNIESTGVEKVKAKEVIVSSQEADMMIDNILKQYYPEEFENENE